MKGNMTNRFVHVSLSLFLFLVVALMVQDVSLTMDDLEALGVVHGSGFVLDHG